MKPVLQWVVFMATVLGLMLSFYGMAIGIVSIGQFVALLVLFSVSTVAVYWDHT
jgi:hypothetical protein